MQIVGLWENEFVLRFDRGEEVLGILKNFCQQQKIFGGVFVGIGAASETVVSWYNPHEQTYKDKILKEDLEVASLTGNVSLLGGEATLHAHGTFSDKNFETFGGHVKKLVVSATCEIWLRAFPVSLSRKPNDEVGLNLLSGV